MARRERLQIGTEDFLRFINSEDDLSLLLRGHLYLEAVLTLILDNALKDGVRDDLENLRFMQRVDFVIGLGKVGSDWRPLFKKVNELRNRYAHNLDARITTEDAQEALALLPPHRSRARERDYLQHPRGPASAIAWCINVLFAQLVNQGLSGIPPDMPRAGLAPGRGEALDATVVTKESD